jgi:hypothetical protein
MASPEQQDIELLKAVIKAQDKKLTALAKEIAQLRLALVKASPTSKREREATS